MGKALISVAYSLAREDRSPVRVEDAGYSNPRPLSLLANERNRTTDFLATGAWDIGA